MFHHVCERIQTQSREYQSSGISLVNLPSQLPITFWCRRQPRCHTTAQPQPHNHVLFKYSVSVRLLCGLNHKCFMAWQHARARMPNMNSYKFIHIDIARTPAISIVWCWWWSFNGRTRRTRSGCYMEIYSTIPICMYSKPFLFLSLQHSPSHSK